MANDETVDVCKLLDEVMPSVDCSQISNFQLDSPANVLILGRTQAGKTHTAFELIRNFPYVFQTTRKIKNIVLVYSEYEEYYDTFVKQLKELYVGVNIVVIDGFFLDKILSTQNYEYEGPNEESILLIGMLFHNLYLYLW